MMHQPSDGVLPWDVYTINKMYENKEWMLAQQTNNANQWTNYDGNALIFFSEKEAEDTIKKFSINGAYVGAVTIMDDS